MACGPRSTAVTADARHGCGLRGDGLRGRAAGFPVGRGLNGSACARLELRLHALDVLGAGVEWPGARQTGARWTACLRPWAEQDHSTGWCTPPAKRHEVLLRPRRLHERPAVHHGPGGAPRVLTERHEEVEAVQAGRVDPRATGGRAANGPSRCRNAGSDAARGRVRCAWCAAGQVQAKAARHPVGLRAEWVSRAWCCASSTASVLPSGRCGRAGRMACPGSHPRAGWTHAERRGADGRC